MGGAQRTDFKISCLLSNVELLRLVCIKTMQHALNSYDAVVIGLTGVDFGAFYSNDAKKDVYLPQLVTIAYSFYKPLVINNLHICCYLHGRYPVEDSVFKEAKLEVKSLLLELFQSIFSNKGDIDYVKLTQVSMLKLTT